MRFGRPQGFMRGLHGFRQPHRRGEFAFRENDGIQVHLADLIHDRVRADAGPFLFHIKYNSFRGALPVKPCASSTPPRPLP